MSAHHFRTLEEDIEALEKGEPPVKGDGFIGSRINPDDASLILLPVPWEATVSFGTGTANAPEAILESSHQLDLELYRYDRPYRAGISMLPSNPRWYKMSMTARKQALNVIEALERGETNDAAAAKVNGVSEQLNEEVKAAAKSWLREGKAVGVVGGDHSTPFGLIKALDELTDENFGILHVDAHHDLREAYEGFTHSHASIFYNVMKQCHSVSRLVQVGIRDYSREEAMRLKSYEGRALCLYDSQMQTELANGQSMNELFETLMVALPKQVYISVDIDGLEPHNCPNTGTPVPGGLRYSELEQLIYMVVKSGRRIIGFDLCEVGSSEDGWDANVGARVLYQLCGALLASQGKIDVNR